MGREKKEKKWGTAQNFYITTYISGYEMLKPIILSD